MALIVAAAITGVTLIGANHRFNTLSAVEALRDRGFNVLWLDLSQGNNNALVVGDGGCIAPITAYLIPGQSGDARVGSKFLGIAINSPRQIICPRQP